MLKVFGALVSIVGLSYSATLALHGLSPNEIDVGATFAGCFIGFSVLSGLIGLAYSEKGF